MYSNQFDSHSVPPAVWCHRLVQFVHSEFVRHVTG